MPAKMRNAWVMQGQLLRYPVVYPTYHHLMMPPAHRRSWTQAPATMKHTTLLALLMGLPFAATAQWVTIPDPAFVAKLTELYPDCMDGDQMDTQCAAIVYETGMYVNMSGISDLTGIEYFVNLEELYCEFNNLTFLPNLPLTLVYLGCMHNDLTTLPELPGSLWGLNCGSNALAELPELPASLGSLHCDNNALTALPELPGSLGLLQCQFNELTTLPELPGSLSVLRCDNNALIALPELPGSLWQLSCSNNALTVLPALPGSLMELDCNSNALAALPELPASLTHLACNNNALAALPELPGSLIQLLCYNNLLTSLPALPSSITQLGCGFNAITELPPLPAALVQLECQWNDLGALPDLPDPLLRLYCFNNDLNALPELPGSLQSLYCQVNQLTSLPDLPGSLARLTCQNNQLSCLPSLPMSLTNNSTGAFSLSGNPFTCLPNYVPAMSGQNAQWLSYPLCDLSDLDNNPYGCAGFEGVVGVVFADENADCELDAGELGVLNAPLRLLDSMGDQLALTQSLGTGVYNFVAGEGEYSVQLVTEDMPYQVSCAVPGEQQAVELTAADPAARDVDFGVECLPGFDVGVQSVVRSGWVFPGQVHTLRVAAGDMSAFYGLNCAAGVSGAVAVQVDGPVSYVGPAPGALTPTVTGPLQFTYTIADFAAVNMQQDFRLQLQTDTTATDDDEVCVEVMVSPVADDFNPGNNIYSQCYSVVNSYDPNIKEVWPVDVGPGYEDYFTYTIYFQNTGSAPAFNIRLADTLDSNLDLNTFGVSAYSHPVLTYLSGNVLTFRFNNIMLPDSTSDPEGSIGYVQYRIKPLPGLEVGTVIENTAHIFFDFNEAIVTNTTQNAYVTSTAVPERIALGLRVFPNPGNGLFQVALSGTKDGHTVMEAYDLAGKLVHQQRMEGPMSVLDLSGQPAGLYLLRVWNALGSEVVRLVKQ